MKRRKIRRNMSEKKLMKLKRSLKKRAKKLRLGKKRTGAYVFGTLRRVRGNKMRKTKIRVRVTRPAYGKPFYGTLTYAYRRTPGKEYDTGVHSSHHGTVDKGYLIERSPTSGALWYTREDFRLAKRRKLRGNPAKRKAEPIPGKFYTVWFSGPKGATNKLVYTGQKLRATPMSDISRAFPVWEAPKMKKFHVAGPYDTYEQAFLH